MEKQPFDYSKPSDQEKFEQLTPAEKEAEKNRAHDEIVAEIHKKAEDIGRSREKAWYRSPSQRDYGQAAEMIASQEKYNQRSAEEQATERERAFDEATVIKNQATEHLQREWYFKPGSDEKPTSEHYAEASLFIDQILKPWEKDTARYETRRESMELLPLTPENNIFLENREEFEAEFPRDVQKETDVGSGSSEKEKVLSTEKRKLAIETYDISQLSIPRGKDDQEVFINSITDGAYFDPRQLTHVLGGANRFYEYGSIDPKEKITRSIWFGAGRSYWFSPEDTVLIVNPRSQRFILFCAKISLVHGRLLGQEEGFRDKATEDDQRKIANDYTAAAHDDKENGIFVDFIHDEACSPTWASISDWIVDLKAKKLYKISEI